MACHDVSVFADIAPNPYYLGIVNKIAYGAAYSDLQGYDLFRLIDDLFFNDYSEEAADSGDSIDWSDLFDFADDYTHGSSGAITFANKPALDDDGNYSFTLTEESLQKTDYVDAAVYFVDDDDTVMCLGFTGDIYADWATGTFSDNFDGYWFCLPDGQYLSVYLVEECDGYDIYTSPVLVNGEDCFLRIVYDYENEEVYPVDIWDGVDECGAADRCGAALEDGDVIVPCYDWYDSDFDFDDSYCGDEYVYDSDEDFGFELLPDGDYLYSFDINDIYGNYVVTDPVLFTIDGEVIRFSGLYATI